jgi:hypothetical protein
MVRTKTLCGAYRKGVGEHVSPVRHGCNLFLVDAFIRKSIDKGESLVLVEVHPVNIGYSEGENSRNLTRQLLVAGGKQSSSSLCPVLRRTQRHVLCCKFGSILSGKLRGFLARLLSSVLSTSSAATVIDSISAIGCSSLFASQRDVLTCGIRVRKFRGVPLVILVVQLRTAASLFAGHRVPTVPQARVSTVQPVIALRMVYVALAWYFAGSAW